MDTVTRVCSPCQSTSIDCVAARPRSFSSPATTGVTCAAEPGCRAMVRAVNVVSLAALSGTHLAGPLIAGKMQAASGP